MAMYAVTFTVEGDGPFPLDMLRYDFCFPETGDAVAAIRKESGEEYPMLTGRRKVRLKRYQDGKALGPTHGRWQSFGWKVIEAATLKV